MIHLLEEQQDEKTDNVTEELVLYLFLGVLNRKTGPAPFFCSRCNNENK